MKEILQTFIAIILFLPLSLLFIVNFVFLKYYLPRFSFSLILCALKYQDTYIHFLLTSSVVSSSSIYTPPWDTTFQLFNRSTLHLETVCTFQSIHTHYQVLFHSLGFKWEEGMKLAQSYSLHFLRLDLCGKV